MKNYGDCMNTCNPCYFEIPALWFPCKDPVNPSKHLQWSQGYLLLIGAWGEIEVGLRITKSICNPKLGIPNPFLSNFDAIICQVYSAFSNLGWLIWAQPFSWHIRQNLKTAFSIESIYLRVKTSCRRMRFPSKDFAFESTDIYNS